MDFTLFKKRFRTAPWISCRRKRLRRYNKDFSYNDKRISCKNAER